ncbi:MAG TPA: hypothetical protein PKK31_04390 [Elusimicrobiales bacterium]|nr:hypothetical protein [Elusimicrobiales bacterium]
MKKLVIEALLLGLAMASAAVFREQMRLSVEAASRNPFKALVWGLVGGAVFLIVSMIVLSAASGARAGIFALLFIPFLAYLYALGSVGLVRLIWNDAFRMRFIVIPAMMTFSYLADISGIPYGGKISAGLLGFGCGCLIAGMGYYDREAELAGERKRDGEAPERVPVAGSTKKLADITPIFKDKDGRYPGAPPGDRDGRD